MKKSDLKELIREEIKKVLSENVTPINDLSDALNFLKNNKEEIENIANQYGGDVRSMQSAIDSFLAPHIENTPEMVVDRLKAAIGKAIGQRNIAANPESSAAYDKLKNIKGLTR